MKHSTLKHAAAATWAPLLALPVRAQQADLLIADFEGPDYGGWQGIANQGRQVQR